MVPARNSNYDQWSRFPEWPVIMGTEIRFEAHSHVSAANRASAFRTRRAPDSSPVSTLLPTRSKPKSPLPVRTDEVYKNQASSTDRTESPLDSAVSPALYQFIHEDTEKFGEEGIYSRQRGQTPSLEAILCQSLIMQRELTDLITRIEATA